MLIGAYVLIVGLTWVLVVMNARSVVQEFVKTRNVVRLYSYLTTLLVLASLIIGVTSAIMQRVLDAESFMKLDQDSPVVRYRR